MKTIHQLSPDTIARIAAGQIIERPADIIKELIENSLDAHSTNIVITLQNSGLDSIEVADNGIGMSKEDLHAAIQPHTTSKIPSDDSLDRIVTYGFRGEALASIAHVSRLMIQSKPKNGTGTEIIVENGEVIEEEASGRNQGTTVHITDLFVNTPVRKLFLSAPRTELNSIYNIVYLFALAHSEVSFTLMHNQKEVAYFPKTTTMADRVPEVIGKSLYAHFFPFTKDESVFQIEGFLSQPIIAQSTDSKIYIFINGRPVRDALIVKSVREGYGSLIAARSFPPFILSLTMPAERIQVNVHPKKQEVRFLDGELVFSTIKHIVGSVLAEHNLTFANASWGKDIDIPLTATERKLPEESVLAQTLKAKLFSEMTTTFHQIDNMYILISTSDQIVILDQHAADERILYEKIKAAYQSLDEKEKVFTFPKPLVVDLNRAEKMLLEDYKTFLEEIGITFEDFGNESIKLMTVPYLMQDFEPIGIIQEIIESLKETGKVKEIDKISHKIMTSLSCRYAVMAGKALSVEEMQRIWNELQLTPNNQTCPHGRPTHVLMGTKELNKIFKR